MTHGTRRLVGIGTLLIVLASTLQSQPRVLKEFVRGINWNDFVTAQIDTMLACNMNVMHGHAYDSLDTAIASKGVTLIVADAQNHFSLPPECERMTFYPSAPVGGADSSKFCFRSISGAHSDFNGLGDGSYSELGHDSAVVFRQIQYGSGQFYQSRRRPDRTRYDSMFFFTLRAERTGNQGTASDTVFTVTIYRMADSGRQCPTGEVKTGPCDSQTFAYLRSWFNDSTVTEIVDSFPWIHNWQQSPYTSAYPIDSTDIVVRFTGKCDMRLYSVTLEDSTAHAFFTADTATLYPPIRDRVRALRTAYDSSIGAWYPLDEGTAATFEPMARMKMLLDHAWREAGASDTAATLSEVGIDIGRSYAGIVKSNVAWVGMHLTRGWSVAPQVDSGFGWNDSARIARMRYKTFGFQHGYKEWYNLDSSNWRLWMTPEYGFDGLQSNISNQMFPALLEGAAMRSGGTRWWSNVFAFGNYDRQARYVLDARVPTTSEVRLLIGASLAFGASGILQYTLRDDHPASSDSADRSEINTGLTAYDLSHATNYEAVSRPNDGGVLYDTIYAGHKANFAEMRGRMKWLKENGSFFTNSRFIGAALRTIRDTVPCDASGRYIDTITFQTAATPVPIVRLGGITTLGTPDDRSITHDTIDDPRFRFWCVAQFRAAGAAVGDSVDYVLVLNTRMDTRDSGDVLLDTCEACDSWRARGARSISVPVHLDGTDYVRVREAFIDSLLDTTTLDVIVRNDSVFTARYLPGQLKIFAVSRAFARNLGRTSLARNNARAAAQGKDAFHATYYRNDSIIYRSSTTVDPTAWQPEVCLAHDAGTTVKYPCIAAISPSASVPAILAIVWQADSNDNWMVRFRARVNRSSGPVWLDPQTLLSYPKAGRTFEPMPVVVPIRFASDTLVGFAVAYSKDTFGIQIMAVPVDTAYAATSNVRTVRATTNQENKTVTDTSCGWVTMREDNTSRTVGLAFQQQASPMGQIFFSQFTVSSSAPHTMTVGAPVTPTWVSARAGNDCDNEHPSIDGAMAYGMSASGYVSTSPPGPQPYCLVPIAPGALPAPEQTWVWQIAYDAFEFLVHDSTVSGSQTVRTIDTTVVVWDAIRDRGSWRHTKFQPKQSSHGHDLTLYPSIRVFDGGDSWANMPGLIGWTVGNAWTQIARARSSSPAQGGLPDWVIIPLRTTPSPTRATPVDSATVPNLEIRGRAYSDYAAQLAVYKRPMDTIAVLLRSLASLDTVGQSKKFVHMTIHNLADNACYRYEVIIFGGAREPHDTNALPQIPQWQEFRRADDSSAFDAGLCAVTDTLHVDSTNKKLVFLRTAYPVDSTGVSSWIGPYGMLSIKLEAASATTGQTLLSINTKNVTQAGLAPALDSVHADLSSILDSTIYFRVRYEATGVTSAGASVAQGVLLDDDESLDSITGGFAKQAHGHRAGANIDAAMNVYPNPSRDRITVRFSIENSDEWRDIVIVDGLGRNVTPLAADVTWQSPTELTFNASQLPQGWYLVRVRCGATVQTRSVSVVR